MIEFTGPDDNGHVWAHWSDETGEHSVNLGPARDVEEAMSQWLASVETRD